MRSIKEKGVIVKRAGRGGAGTQPFARDCYRETVSARPGVRAVRGPAPPTISKAVVLAAEIAGERWFVAFSLGPSRPSGLLLAGALGEGPGDRLRAVSCRAPEPSPWLRGPGLEAAVNPSPIPTSSDLVASDSLHGSQSTEASATGVIWTLPLR